MESNCCIEAVRLRSGGSRKLWGRQPFRLVMKCGAESRFPANFKGMAAKLQTAANGLPEPRMAANDPDRTLATVTLDDGTKLAEGICALDTKRSQMCFPKGLSIPSSSRLTTGCDSPGAVMRHSVHSSSCFMHRKPMRCHEFTAEGKSPNRDASLWPANGPLLAGSSQSPGFGCNDCF